MHIYINNSYEKYTKLTIYMHIKIIFLPFAFKVFMLSTDSITKLEQKNYY